MHAKRRKEGALERGLANRVFARVVVVVNLGAEITKGHRVLDLAGHRAGVTADAALGVDGQTPFGRVRFSISHVELPSSTASQWKTSPADRASARRNQAHPSRSRRIACTWTRPVSEMLGARYRNYLCEVF